MRRLVSALAVSFAAIATAASSPAFAADMPMKAYPAPAPSAPATYDWSGFYIGGHVGGGFANTNYADPSIQPILTNCCLLVSSTTNPTGFADSHSSAFLGGAQVGWMYQVSRLVVGADFDWSWTGVNGSSLSTTSPLVAGGDFATEGLSVKTNWTATATTTVGLARDRWMIFGKGGAAFAENNYGLTVAGVGGTGGGPGGAPFGFASSTNQTIAGWTAGVGLKWALTDNMFFNLEYDYLDFGSNTPHLSGNFTATPAAFAGATTAATFTPTFNQNISEVKFGLNYKFAPGFLFW